MQAQSQLKEREAKLEGGELIKGEEKAKRGGIWRPNEGVETPKFYENHLLPSREKDMRLAISRFLDLEVKG